MEFANPSTKDLAKKSLLWFLIIISFAALASESAPAQTQTADKANVLRDVASKWMAVGTEQYNRGQYIRAEQSLLYAMDYQRHLTKKELAELEALLTKIRKVLLQRHSIQKAIEAAEQLIVNGSLFEAKAKLENLLSQTTTSPQQQKQIKDSLNKIEVKLQVYAKQMDKIYKNVITSYLNGRLYKARQNLLEIDSILTQIKGDSTIKKPQTLQVPAPEPVEIPTEQETKEEVIKIPEEKQQDQIKDETAELHKKELGTDKKDILIAIEPETKQAQRKKKPLSQKEKIVRSYTKAVVNDATEKAKRLIKQKNLQQALKVVRQAEQIVNQNRQYLGEEIYNQYNLELNGLTEQITSKTGSR